jgi:alkylhydroperoxidase family enzyme
MEPRVDFMKVGQGAFNALLGVEKYIHGSGLEPTLLHLIKIRASQINGCAYCIDKL